MFNHINLSLSSQKSHGDVMNIPMRYGGLAQKDQENEELDLPGKHTISLQYLQWHTKACTINLLPKK